MGVLVHIENLDNTRVLFNHLDEHGLMYQLIRSSALPVDVLDSYFLSSGSVARMMDGRELSSARSLDSKRKRKCTLQVGDQL